jgi:hypothetical protein
LFLEVLLLLAVLSILDVIFGLQNFIPEGRFTQLGLWKLFSELPQL